MSFLGTAFGAAIMLIYLILATQFNSVIKPFIIFFTIILSLIGVLLGFIIFNKDFSIIMSGVGIIALAGIVVKNGILLIEFIEELRGRGYPMREAIIEGGAIRLTPVLLTASAAVLGLVPLALGITVDFVGLFRNLEPHLIIGGPSSVFWNILAWTIIFGLTFSTILNIGNGALHVLRERACPRQMVQKGRKTEVVNLTGRTRPFKQSMDYCLFQGSQFF